MKPVNFQQLTTSEQNNIVSWFCSQPARRMTSTFPFLKDKLDAEFGVQFIGMDTMDWDAVSTYYINKFR